MGASNLSSHLALLLEEDLLAVEIITTGRELLIHTADLLRLAHFSCDLLVSAMVSGYLVLLIETKLLEYFLLA